MASYRLLVITAALLICNSGLLRINCLPSAGAHGHHDHEISARSLLPVDPEVNYGPTELITTKGYPAETHWVTTVDGYILQLDRIPRGRNTPASSEPRPVFFLQHGLIGSSTDWIINPANESLGFILADRGFDVWMGNVRGNTYSKNHTTLKVNSREFWNFTFDEHALKDLPAMLNYVLQQTGQKKLFYVGHSQGTIMGFAGFTVNQSLAEHIHAFFALAPVNTVEHIQGAFAVIARFSSEVNLLWNLFSYGEFIPNSAALDFLSEHVCTVSMKLRGACANIAFLIGGFNEENLNLTRLPVYYTHTPAGTSIKNALHFSQEVRSGRFAMFDYGEKNMQQYGMSTSPSYNVSEIRVPMALYTGGRDWVANPTDINNALPQINKTGHVFYRKDIKTYNHLDFIWGLDAATQIYDEIVMMANGLIDEGGDAISGSYNATGSMWSLIGLLISIFSFGINAL